MIARKVTVAKIQRKYWESIEAGVKRYEVRDESMADGSLAFVFMDADTGRHLGNARIGKCMTFGCDGGEWTWNMLSKLSDVPVAELQGLFPGYSPDKEYPLFVYEIQPVSDDELLQLITADIDVERNA